MPIDTPPSSRSFTMRTLLVAGLGLAGLILVSAYLARTSIASYLIEDALEGAGLKNVTVRVSALNTQILKIDELSAENGALAASNIEAEYSPAGLLSSRLNALRIGKANLTLVWDGSGLKLGAFPLEWDPNAGPLEIPYIGSFRATDVALRITTPKTTLNAPLSITAGAIDDGWNTTLNGKLTGTGVDIGIEWTGLIVAADLARSVGRGRLNVNVDDFALPGISDQVDAEGAITVNAENNTFSVIVDKPIVFSFSSALQPLAGNAATRDLSNKPWSVTLASSHSQTVLLISTAEGRRSVKFDLAGTAVGADSRIDLSALGEASQSASGNRVQLSAAQARLRNLPLAGGMVSGHIALSDVDGNLSAAQGHMDAALNWEDLTLDGMMMGEGDASLAGRLQIANGAATFDVETLQLGLAEASLGDWSLTAPTRLELAKGKTGGQRIGFVPLQDSFIADLALTLPELRAANIKDAAETLLLRLPDLALTGKAGAPLGLTARGFSMQHTALDLRNGQFDATIEDQDVSAKTSAQIFRIGPDTQDRAAPRPLAISATLTTRDQNVDVGGALATESGVKLGDFNGRFDAGRARGSAAFSMPKTRFERGGKIGAADLSFIAPVTDLTGTIGIQAKVSWTGDQRTGTAIATFEDVGFALGDLSVAGLSTTVDLASLSPPRSAAPHQVSAQSIAAGLPLTNLRAGVSFGGDGTATISQGSVDVAGGQITLADALVPIEGQEGAFVLGVQKLDMAQLATLAKIDGLSVSGTLTGTVPLRSADGGFYFNEGILRADAPGRVIYKPASPPQALSQSQGGNLLLQALSNFAYDRLSLTLNGPVTEEIVVTLSLAGKNPDLYGGYPIEFNLNLSGRLTQMMSQGLVGYGLPADLERRLREGRPPGP